MFEHLFRVCIRTMSALRLKDHANSIATLRRAHPIRKEMGARSQRRCLPGPIPNPEVKPSCVSPITVVRESTGKEVTVPLSFHLGSSPRLGAIWPDPEHSGPAFFAFWTPPTL
jgi:hypothetical protein